MNAIKQYPQYAPIAKHIQAAQLGRVIVIAEWIAEAIMSVVREVKAPPRPAWIVVEESDRKLGGERVMKFMPRWGFE